MRKLHAIAISLLLGGVAVAGAAAALKTVHLGATVAAPQAVRVPDGVIAARREKLAKWSASLHQARAAQPPRLPRIPRFAPVVVPTVPATLEAAPPPAPSPPPVRHVVQRRVVTLPAKHVVRSAPAPAPQPAAPQQQPPAAVVQQTTAPTTTSSSSPPAGRDDEGESSEGVDGHEQGGDD